VSRGRSLLEVDFMEALGLLLMVSLIRVEIFEKEEETTDDALGAE